MTRQNTPRISFIGFGEAGQTIASGLREGGIERIAAWDILFPKPEGDKLKAAGDKMGVRLASSAADAVRDTDMIISAVTAASSYEAAQSVEPHLSGNPWYLDINSVSPGRKQKTAALLDGKARYVDVAVIAPIHPARHKTPLLIAGPHAEAISPLLEEMEMKLKVVSPDTGKAAAIKMIRSVMIKGIEALTLECYLAASRAGLLDEVLVSMKNNYPGARFRKDGRLQHRAHGKPRRAPRRRDGRIRRHAARTRPRPVDGRRHCQAPARDGRHRQGRKRAGDARSGPRRHAHRHQRGQKAAPMTPGA